MAYSSVSNVLLISIGSQDRAINFYDTLNKKKISSILCPDQLSSVAFNSDGFTLAVGTQASIGKKGQIHIYDLRMTSEEYTTEPVLTLQGHTSTVNSVQFKHTDVGGSGTLPQTEVIGSS